MFMNRNSVFVLLFLETPVFLSNVTVNSYHLVWYNYVRRKMD